MRSSHASALAFIAILAATPGLAADLPPVGPLPATRPAPQAATEQQPQSAPQPMEKPEMQGPPAPPRAETEAPGPLKGTVLTPEEELVIAPESAEDHAECVAALTALGTVFKEEKRIDEGEGCGIDKPVSVSGLAGGIKLQPGATMTCPAAVALSRWTQEAIVPAAKAAFPEKTLQTLETASAYICRLRNNAEKAKISEHARGNAIDVSAFTLSGGERVDIHPRREDATLSGAFQRSVTATACLYFTTVLDPESDAAHEKHLHLDVLSRKGGYRYCR